MDILSKVAKFPDDTKLRSPATCIRNCNKIQSDLVKLADGSDKWQMCFNVHVDKCKVMHIGDNNPNFKYQMHGHELSKVRQEKDLGVIISNYLKTSDQCTAAS